MTGFQSIVEHLRKISSGQWDLNAHLTPMQNADCLAYGSPLLPHHTFSLTIGVLPIWFLDLPASTKQLLTTHAASQPSSPPVLSPSSISLSTSPRKTTLPARDPLTRTFFPSPPPGSSPPNAAMPPRHEVLTWVSHHSISTRLPLILRSRHLQPWQWQQKPCPPSSGRRKGPSRQLSEVLKPHRVSG